MKRAYERSLRLCVALVGGSLALTALPLQAATYYVSPSGNDFNMGTSWFGPFRTLTKALAEAKTAGDEIWVAAGTYTPGPERSDSFLLAPDVIVYGGFAGGESLISERNLTRNATVLSGDIGVAGATGDNSYHVVRGAPGAILDGFTITGGNADGTGTADSAYGAGCYINGTSPVVRNCRFLANNAWYGGAAAVTESGTAPAFENCFFIDNHANVGGMGGAGGAVKAADGATPSFVNCVFSGNTALGATGGALAAHDSGGTVMNCTFTNNVAANGGAAEFSNSTMEIRNSIFAGDTATDGDEVQVTSGPAAPDISYCLLPGSLNSLPGFASTGVPATGSDNLMGAPLFISGNQVAGPDGLYGTLDDGLRLKPGSPCLGAGTPTGAPATDLLNIMRSPGIDVGAYQDGPQVLYVKQGATGNGDGMSWANAKTSLQAAFAAAVPGAEIWVAAGTYKPAPPAGNRALTFQLPDNVALYGGFDTSDTAVARDERNPATNLCVLSGDLDGNDGPSFTNRSDNSNHVVTGAAGAALDGFTVRGGNADSGTGGGLLCDAVTMSVRSCTFSDNEANGDVMAGGGAVAALNGANIGFSDCRFLGNRVLATSALGGAVYAGQSAVTFDACRFAGNSAQDGGALAVVEGNGATLRNCKFGDNFASSLGGAGHFSNTEYSSGNPKVLVSGCEFAGNKTSPGSGGALYFMNADFRVYSSTFVGNSSTNGGAVYNDGSQNALIANCTFRSNTANGASGGASLKVAQTSSTWMAVSNSLFDGGYASGEGREITADGALYFRRSLVNGTAAAVFGSNVSLTDIQWVEPRFLASLGGQWSSSAMYDASTGTTVLTDSAGGGNWPADQLVGSYVKPDPSDERWFLVVGNSSSEIHILGDMRWANAGLAYRILAVDLQSGSPAIDAADGDDAPDYALHDQPRGDDLSAANTGTGARLYADIGAVEAPYGQHITYVHFGGSAGGDGLSWATAFNSLSAALLSGATAYTDLWVTGGTAVTPGARADSFALPPKVRLFGGFAGNELDIQTRNDNLRFNPPTVLSGDRNGDDGVNFTNRSDNAYHVVTLGDFSVLNGVHVTGGHADGTAQDQYGGAAAIQTRHVLLENVDFYANAATAGGACYLFFAQPISLRSCRFYDNLATQHGGALFAINAMADVSDCQFSHNEAAAGNGGAALLKDRSQVQICRSSFSGNSAAPEALDDEITYGHGGALFILDVRQCAVESSWFSGNRARNGAAAAFVRTTSNGFVPDVIFRHCDFVQNEAANRGGAIKSASGLPDNPAPDLTLANCISWENQGAVGYQEFYQATGTLTVNSSFVSGGFSGGNPYEGSASWAAYSEVDRAALTGANPGFFAPGSGTWDGAATYDPGTHLTVLKADGTNWRDGQWAGMSVKPAAANPLQFVILDNTANTLKVLGNASFIADEETFTILDPHLTGTSLCIDAANDGFASAADFESEARFNHPALPVADPQDPPFVDIGMDEYFAPTILPFNPTSVSASERTTPAVFTVQLGAPSHLPVTVTYETQEIAPGNNDNAVSPDDFQEGVSGTLTFLPGVTSMTVEVSVVDDDVRESTEMFKFVVMTATNAFLQASALDRTVEYFIQDNDLYWTGTMNSDWSNPDNWNPMGVFSTMSYVAHFAGTPTSSPLINAPGAPGVPLVAGIKVHSDFTGTITQEAGVPLYVGTEGFIMEAGTTATFTGSDAPITILGDLVLADGSFTSTSGLLRVRGSFVHSGGTFSHNNGTLMLSPADNSPRALNVAGGNPAFNHVVVNSCLEGLWRFDSLYALSVSGDTNNQISDWQNLTGLDFSNTDNGTLYARIRQVDTSNFVVELFTDFTLTDLVGHSNWFTGSGPVTITEEYAGGVSGTLTITTAGVPIAEGPIVVQPPGTPDGSGFGRDALFFPLSDAGAVAQNQPERWEFANHGAFAPAAGPGTTAVVNGGDIPASAADYSAVVWFRTVTTPGTGGNYTLIARTSGFMDDFAIEMTPAGHITGHVSSGGSPVSLTVAQDFADDDWHLAALFRDKDRAYLTVDQLSPEQASCSTPSTPMSNNFYFGSRPDGSDRFAGTLDEARYYSRKLSLSDIRALAGGRIPRVAQGTIQLNGALNVAGSLTLNSGVLEMPEAATTVSVGMDWVNNGALFVAKQSNALLFTEAAGTRHLQSGQQPFNGLTLNTNNGGTYILDDPLLVTDALNLGTGLDVSAWNWSVSAATVLQTPGTAFNTGSSSLVLHPIGTMDLYLESAVNRLFIQDPADENLALYWPFDDADGQVVRDFSGNGQDGTPVGTLDWVRGPQTAIPVQFHNPYVLALDGSAAISQASLGFDPLTADFICGLWIKCQLPAKDAILLAQAPTGNSPLRVWLGINTDGVLSSGLGSSLLSSQREVCDNQWHHVMLYGRGADMELWVDGISQSTETRASGVADGALWLGSGPDLADAFFGMVDDFRIYYPLGGLTDLALQTLPLGHYSGASAGSNTVRLQTSLAVGEVNLIHGILRAIDGSGGSHDSAVSGDWNNYSTPSAFNPGNGMVTLTGDTQTVRGVTRFYDLQKTGTGADSLMFAPAATLVVDHHLTLTGDAGNSQHLTLAGNAPSQTPADRWEVHVEDGGTKTLNWLDVADSSNTSTARFNLVGTDSVDSGNNSRWVFGPPTVTVNDLTTADPTPTLTGTVSDPAATVTVSIVDNANNNLTATNNGDGTWTLPGSAFVEALTENPYTVSATATDDLGNTSDAATGALDIDLTPPDVALGAPDTYATRSGPVTFTVTFTGAESVYMNDNTFVTFDPTGTVTHGLIDVTGTGLASRTVTINDLAGDGSFTIAIHAAAAADAVGNNSMATADSESVTVDNTGPTATFSAVTPSPSTVSPVSFTLEFDEDVSGFAGTDIDATYGIITNFTPLSAQAFSFDLEPDMQERTVTLGIAAGKCTDALGNPNAATGAYNYTFDLNPPAAPVITWPLDGSTRTNPTVNLRGTAEAGSVVHVLKNGDEVGTVTAIGGNWALVVGPLPDGSYSFTAYAKDAAGNEGPASDAVAVTIASEFIAAVDWTTSAESWECFVTGTPDADAPLTFVNAADFWGTTGYVQTDLGNLAANAGQYWACYLRAPNSEPVNGYFGSASVSVALHSGAAGVNLQGGSVRFFVGRWDAQAGQGQWYVFNTPFATPPANQWAMNVIPLSAEPGDWTDVGGALSLTLAQALEQPNQWGFIVYNAGAQPTGTLGFDSLRVTNGPTVTLAYGPGQTSPTNVSPVQFQATFSAAVDDFDDTDVDTAASTADITAVSVTGTVDVYDLTLTLNPAVAGAAEVIIPAGVAHDSNGKASQLFSYTPGANRIVFDATAPAAPTVTGTSPTSNPRPTWSWTSGGGGNGTFRRSLDAGVTWIETTSLFFTPATDLAAGTHTLLVQERDAVGNWSTSGSLAITIDLQGPQIQMANLFPADNATGVAIDGYLELVFNEDIAAGTGYLHIFKASDDTLVASYAATDPEVSLSTNAATIVPSILLGPDSAYYVQVDADFVTDTVGNPAAGIADKSSWSFTTGNPLGVPAAEHAALVALYNGTKGSSWTLRTNWLTPDAPWHGVTVTGDPAHVTGLNLGDNNLDGELPAAIGDLTSLTSLALNGNLLTGSIPAAIGNLTALQSLWLSSNGLTGTVPSGVTALTGLTVLDIAYNGLVASGATDTFLSARQPTWKHTQTVTPTGLEAVAATASSIELTWNPIAYQADDGYYEVGISTDDGGPYTYSYQTDDTSATGITLTGLEPDATYYLVLRAHTPAHAFNLNSITSPDTPQIAAATDPADATAPAVTTYVPAQNATGVSAVANLALTYDEDIVRNAGTVRVYEADGTLLETINMDEIAKVSIAGDNRTLVLNPDTNLPWNTVCYVLADAGIVKDTTGNDCAAITNPATWRFTVGNPLGVPETEFNALVALYNATDGANWTDQATNNWLTQATPWTGILVTGNHVKELRRPGMMLTGTLPATISSLDWLTVLDLSANQIGGELPTSMATMVNLRELYLDHNALTGAFPDPVTYLIDLTELALDFNHFEGPLSDYLADLTHLQTLTLAGNAFSGEIPTGITALASLALLDLSYNGLQATDVDAFNFVTGLQPLWQNTQTRAPTAPGAHSPTTDGATVSWNPIVYTTDGGYYEVGTSTVSGGVGGVYTFNPAHRTANKAASSWPLTGLNPGTTYYAVVRSYTPAHPGTGNANPVTSAYSAEVSFTTTGLDTTPPTATIIKAATQSEPTNDAEIRFTVTFSEPVTGFSATGVTLGGTAAGVLGATVTGSGTTYDVTVTGMTGTGSVTAAVKASAAADTALNPNTASGTATVQYDVTAPTATVAYSTTAPTNADVVATLNPGEAVTVTNNAGALAYTFTANGSFTFEFVDAAGNTGTALATVGNIDKAAPTATVTYSTTAPTNADVVATLNPGEAVTVTNNAGALAYTFAANGSFTFEFVDAAGNTGTALATVGNIDKAAPTVSIGAPDLTLTKSGPVFFTVTYSADSTVTLSVPQITLNINGDVGGTVSVLAGGTAQERIVRVSGLDGNGIVAISIAAGTAYDAAGNYAPAAGPSAAVTVDNTAPTVTVVAQTTTVPQPALNGTVNDPGAAISVVVNGQTFAATNDGAGSWSLAAGIIGPLANGVYNVQVSATDSAGNVGSDATADELTINATGLFAPTVAATTPTSDQTPTWTWTTGGGTGFGLFRHQLDAETEGAWSAETTTTTFTPVTALAGGTYTLYVQERDETGNWSVSGSLAVTIDLMAPTLVISAPMPAALTNTGPVYFVVTYTGANIISLSPDDVTVNLLTGTVPTGDIVVTVTPISDTERKVELSNLSGNGELSISLAADTARDLAGNQAAAAGPSTPFTVDNTPPGAPTVTGVTATADQQPSWYWSSSGGGNGTYRVQVDSEIGTWTDVAATGYTVAAALTDGAYTLYVQERDAAGNWSVSGSFTTTVDSTAPVIATCPGDRTVAVGVDCQGLVPDLTAEVAATDAVTPVGNLAITQAPVAGTAIAANATVTVTLYVEDALGNEATCSAEVTASDTTPPVAACRNITVYLDNEGTASVAVSDVLDASSDNCEVTSLSLSRTTFTCADRGDNLVTLTAADASGNSSTCEAVVAVVDTLEPVITGCPGAMTISVDGSGYASLPDLLGSVSATDNCTSAGAFSKTQQPAAGTEVLVGQTLSVDIQVADEAGNYTVCTIEVTALDNTPPAAPTITVTLARNSAQPVWSWTSADVTGTGTFRHQLDGTVENGWSAETEDSHIAWPAELTAGTHTLYIQERDVAGNWSASGSAAVTVQITRPVVSGFDVVNLGALGGTESRAFKISDQNAVVGYYRPTVYSLAGFRWDGNMTAIPVSGLWSAAYAVNGNGQIAGFSFTDSGYSAFRHSDGTTTAIGSAGNGSQAFDINDSGLVVGTYDSGSARHAFVSAAGSALTDIGTLGGAASAAYAVNLTGTVVGEAQDSGGVYRATVWKATRSGGYTPTAIPVPDAVSASAHAINDDGYVTGQFHRADGELGAFLFTGTAAYELLPLAAGAAAANGINNAGKVVGFSADAEGALHAACWTADTPVDLNDYLPANSGWVLHAATDINNGGAIVGYGDYDGDTRAFLLQPQAGRNIAPHVTLVEPQAGSTFAAGGSIWIQALAADPDSAIASVTIRQGETVLATLTQWPYAYRWNNVPAGTYSLSAEVVDSYGASAVTAVVVSVVGNATPVAQPDSYSTPRYTPLNVVTTSGVLSNDTDADGGQTLTAELVSGPLYGTLELQSDGSFTYAPPMTETSLTSDRFVYRTSDALAASADTTVTISLQPQTLTFSLPLKSGWNLVSVPINPADNSVAGVFGNVILGACWEWGGTQFVQATRVVPRQGYWVYCDGSDTALTIQGTPTDNGIASLQAGWNLIGAVSKPPYNSFQPSWVVQPEGRYDQPMYLYENGVYQTATELTCGKAYWIHCQRPVSLPVGP